MPRMCNPAAVSICTYLVVAKNNVRPPCLNFAVYSTYMLPRRLHLLDVLLLSITYSCNRCTLLLPQIIETVQVLSSFLHQISMSGWGPKHNKHDAQAAYYTWQCSVTYTGHCMHALVTTAPWPLVLPAMTHHPTQCAYLIYRPYTPYTGDLRLLHSRHLNSFILAVALLNNDVTCPCTGNYKSKRVAAQNSSWRILACGC